MNFNSTSMQSTYDFASMSALKKGSTGSSAERAQAGEKVAAEFEAEFLRLVTSSMQKASEPFKSDLFSSNSSHFLAQRKSIGVADFVVNSLSEQGQKGSGEV